MIFINKFTNIVIFLTSKQSITYCIFPSVILHRKTDITYMKTLIWFIRGIIYILTAIPDSRKIKKLRAAGDFTTANALVEARARHWAASMMANAGVTVEVHGKENIPQSTALIVPNHQSDWDIPIMLAYGPFCGILAKKEIAKIPVVRRYMEYFNCRFIDREDPRKALRTLKEVEGILKSGESFTIYAEGTRSRNEELGDFHNHSLLTAAKQGIDIVPVSIDGSYRIMEIHNRFRITPSHVILTFLPPIHTAGMDRKERNSLGETVKAEILKGRKQSRALSADCDNCEEGLSQS